MAYSIQEKSLNNLLIKSNRTENEVTILSEDTHNDLNSILTGLQIGISGIEQSIVGLGDDEKMGMYMPSTAIDKISRVEQQFKLLQSEVKYLVEATNATSTTLTDFSNQFASMSTIVTGIQTDLLSVSNLLNNTVQDEQSLGAYLSDKIDKVKSVSSAVESGLGWFSDFAGAIPIIGPTVASIAKVGARVANTITGVTGVLQKSGFTGYLDTAQKVTAKIAELVIAKEKADGFASTTAELTQYANYAAGVTINAFEKIVALNAQTLSTVPTGRYYLRPLSFIPFSDKFIDKFKSSESQNLIINPNTRFPAHGIAMLEWPITSTTLRRITISTGDWNKAQQGILSLIKGGSMGSQFAWEDSIWTSSGSGASQVWSKTSSSVQGTGAPFDYDLITEAGETFPLCMTADMVNGYCQAYAECTLNKNYNLFNYNCHIQALAAINYARYGKTPAEWNNRCAALLLKTMTGGITLYDLDSNNRYTVPNIQQVITGATSGFATVDANINTINSAAINQGGAAYLGATSVLNKTPIEQLPNDPSEWQQLYSVNAARAGKLEVDI